MQSAFRTAIPRDEEATPGALLAQARTTWHLWKANLLGLVPKVADVISQGGVRWTIQAVAEQAQGQRYRCLCVQER